MFTLKNLPPTMRQSLLSTKCRSSIRKKLDNDSSSTFTTILGFTSDCIFRLASVSGIICISMSEEATSVSCALF